MSKQHAAIMRSWQVTIINGILDYERISQHTLPAGSFYKAVAGKILKSYGLTWATVESI
jgi:hypothetical protein